MNREELVEQLAALSEIAPESCEKVVSAFEQTLVKMAVSRDSVWLAHDVGGFYVQEVGNPYGENTPRFIPKLKYQFRFKVSRALKKQLFQTDEEYYAMLEEMGRHEQVEILKRRAAEGKEDDSVSADEKAI